MLWRTVTLLLLAACPFVIPAGCSSSSAPSGLAPVAATEKPADPYAGFRGAVAGTDTHCGDAGECACTQGADLYCGQVPGGGADSCIHCASGTACAKDLASSAPCLPLAATCPTTAPTDCNDGFCCPTSAPVCCGDAKCGATASVCAAVAGDAGTSVGTGLCTAANDGCGDTNALCACAPIPAGGTSAGSSCGSLPCCFRFDPPGTATNGNPIGCECVSQAYTGCYMMGGTCEDVAQNAGGTVVTSCP